MHHIRINHLEVKLTSTSLAMPSVAYKLSFNMEDANKTQTNLLSTPTYTDREIILLAYISTDTKVKIVYLLKTATIGSLPTSKLDNLDAQLNAWRLNCNF